MQATATPTLRATNVSADDSCAYVDGVIVDLLVTHVAGDPSVGYPASIDGEHVGAPRLDRRDDWDAAHPDVEPTAENMLALVESAADEIQEHVEEAVARRADDWAPDDDGPEWNDSDERGWS